MKRVVLGVLLCCFVCRPAVAQSGQEGAASKDPLSAWLRRDFQHSRNFIAKAAEIMPEGSYGMRPGLQPEVRTFGQIVGHLANFNYLLCSDAKAEKNPAADQDFEKLTSKAELIKAVNAAFSYCDGVYASITDSMLMNSIMATADDGKKVPALRISRLIINTSHNQEHYGNIVTYMRIKGMVPPSSMAQ